MLYNHYFRTPINYNLMKFLIQLLLLIFFQAIHAQEITNDLYLKRSTRQDDQTFQFKVMENTNSSSITYQPKKFYYWFKSQVVVRTQGAASGQLLHGLFESFYDNKQLSSRGNFSKGLKQGVWMYWNLDGILVRIETWEQGEKRGDEILYDSKGKWLESIEHGSRSIERKTKDSIIVTDKVGLRKKVVLLDSIGNPFQTIKYKNGYPVKEKEGRSRVKSRKLKEEESGVKSQESKVESRKRKDVRQETEGNFWKRLFSKKKKDHPSQQPPKKFTWKFWKNNKDQ